MKLSLQYFLIGRVNCVPSTRDTFLMAPGWVESVSSQWEKKPILPASELEFHRNGRKVPETAESDREWEWDTGWESLEGIEGWRCLSGGSFLVSRKSTVRITVGEGGLMPRDRIFWVRCFCNLGWLPRLRFRCWLLLLSVEPNSGSAESWDCDTMTSAVVIFSSNAISDRLCSPLATYFVM